MNKVIGFIGFVLATNFGFAALPISKLGAPVRTELIKLLAQRVEREKEEIVQKQREVEYRNGLLRVALKANEQNPGTYAPRQVIRMQLEASLAQELQQLSNDRLQEATVMLSLMEEAVQLGIDLPLRIEYKP